MKNIYRLWADKPLEMSIVAALIVRLLAAFFSRGYGMHDDHFIVIEDAQRMVDYYLSHQGQSLIHPGDAPAGHSFFYPGLHFFFFLFLQKSGICDPQLKMLFVRLVHAVFSVVTVIYAYKIVDRYSGKKIAGQTALLMALLWFFPFFSVRNLVETACIPFLVYAVWLIIKAGGMKRKNTLCFTAGFVLGLAFSIRYQTFTFAAGVFLVLLLKKYWMGFLSLSAGYLISILLFQGGVDYWIWGKPFAEFQEYVNYNILHATAYIVNPWYTYFLLIFGLLIPPLSIFLFTGFFKNWKKNLEIFLPALLFLIFHSVFPNKQERFIFPILPFIIILGMIGWDALVTHSTFWKKNHLLLKTCWVFFWCVNLLLLLPVSTAYSKRVRVESMTYLSHYQNLNEVIICYSPDENPYLLPQFYLGKPIGSVQVTGCQDISDYNPSLSADTICNDPGFVLFSGTSNLPERIAEMKEKVPDLVYETVIKPGFIDDILFQLNPVNNNQIITIYRNAACFPMSCK